MKQQSLIYAFLFLSSCIAWGQFNQVGPNITGELEFDEFGRSVAISADGSRLAVGAPRHINEGSGYVNIYEYNGQEWAIVGNPIYDEGWEFSGTSVSLSADGNRVAIGVPGNSATGYQAGSIRIYEYDGSDWVMLGQNIAGATNGFSFGMSVSLSADGSRVVAGGAGNGQGAGYGVGYARTFQYDGMDWVQIGQDLNEDFSSGMSVSMSADGSTIAIGARYDDSNGDNSGRARIYSYDGTNWVQMGATINGEAASSLLGESVSLSEDGGRVAISAIGNDISTGMGHTLVYDYNGSGWIQIGNIVGNPIGTASGRNVSMSGSGNSLALTAMGDGTDNNTPHARIYNYDGINWTEVGNTAVGNPDFDSPVTSLAFSQGGQRLALGITADAGGGIGESELAQVYDVSGIRGLVYNDIDQDCAKGEEVGVSGQYAIIEPGGIVVTTQASGEWLLESLPVGDYTITYYTSGTWESGCPVTQSFTITNPEALFAAPAFGMVSTNPCSAPGISIHMPFMRPCFENQRIYVQACNTTAASGILENAYAVVNLDPLITPTSFSLPYTDLGGNSYQFDLGTINPGICENFWIDATLSCDAVLGQTLCMDANLYPVEDCALDTIPAEPYQNITPCETDYDNSFIRIHSYCENDSLFFVISNAGEGDMSCFSPVTLYINGQLILLDSVQLAAGENMVYTFAGDGQTWHMEVEQHPLHPGDSQPSTTIEACGNVENWTSGFFNILPHDDADPVVDIYCGEVTGSYDPNDKTGFPLGVSEEHLIPPNRKMDYLIRFQNTGTDTAFTVVIRDTLEMDFDLFSVQSGVASHPYDFKIYGPRVLEWTFNDILLPDSTTNEPGSHGFITFTVKQNPNLPNGTELTNSAGIYFDYNAPIITNTSSHIVDDMLQTPSFLTEEEFSNTDCLPLTYNGITYTQSGTYYQVSDDGLTLTTINVVVLESSFSSDGISLTANISDAEYQWLDCDNGNSPIDGATGQVFTPSVSGNYALQISQDDCSNISDCQSFFMVGTQDLTLASTITAYPNPTQGELYVDMGRVYKGGEILIRNILGQTVGQFRFSNTSSFKVGLGDKPGIYLLSIFTENGQSATVKVHRE